MKKVIFIAIATLLAACGTVHRAATELRVDRDSTAYVKSNTIAITKLDSSGATVDRSLIIIKNHTVTDEVAVANTYMGASSLGKLFLAPQIIAAPDSDGNVILTYDKATNMVGVTVVQKAVHRRIVSDNATTEHRDIAQQSYTHKIDSIKAMVRSKTSVHVATVKKSSDKVKTGIVITWYVYAVIGLILFFGIILFIAYKKYSKII